MCMNMFMSSVESQKGINVVQQRSAENQKGVILPYSLQKEATLENEISRK